MDDRDLADTAQDLARAGRVALGKIGPGRYRVWLDRRLVGTVTREARGWAARGIDDQVLGRGVRKRASAARDVVRGELARLLAREDR